MNSFVSIEPNKFKKRNKILICLSFNLGYFLHPAVVFVIHYLKSI